MLNITHPLFAGIDNWTESWPGMIHDFGVNVVKSFSSSVVYVSGTYHDVLYVMPLGENLSWNK